MYCQHCGNPTHDPAEAEVEIAAEAGDAAEGVAETVSIAEVEIARINADRDVTLAKIEKGILHEQIEAEVVEDAVKAELLDEVLAEPEPEPVPVVMEDAPAEPEVSEEPPPIVDAEPEPAGKSHKSVWW